MRIALLVLAATGAMLPWLISAPLAHACSVGPDFDPVAASDLIVGGRITGWEVIENVTTWDPKTSEPQPTHDPNYYGGSTPIRLRLVVDTVYKGVVEPNIELVAANTYQIRDGQGYWIGSGGSCGAFDWDPTGQYWILGLGEDDVGRYRPSLPTVWLSGIDEPTGETYDRVVADLESRLGPASLPVTGGPPGTAGASNEHLMSIVGGLALIAASVVVFERAAIRSHQP